jgi:hypothetical protein
MGTKFASVLTTDGRLAPEYAKRCLDPPEAIGDVYLGSEQVANAHAPNQQIEAPWVS